MKRLFYLIIFQGAFLFAISMFGSAGLASLREDVSLAAGQLVLKCEIGEYGRPIKDDSGNYFREYGLGKTSPPPMSKIWAVDASYCFALDKESVLEELVLRLSKLPKLQRLDIARIWLTTSHQVDLLVGALSNLVELRYLNMQQNWNSSFKAAELFISVLPKLCHLEHLDLSSWDGFRTVRLEKSITSLTSLAKALSILKNLRFLNLGNNLIGDCGLETLKEAIGSLESLTYLNVQNNSLTTKGIGVLTEILRQLPALQNLNIRLNRATIKVISDMVLALNPAAMQHLDIAQILWDRIEGDPWERRGTEVDFRKSLQAQLPNCHIILYGTPDASDCE